MRWCAGLRKSVAVTATPHTRALAASATFMSDGLVAMQASLAPTTAMIRLNPPIAEQPEPGSRLLQGKAVS